MYACIAHLSSACTAGDEEVAPHAEEIYRPLVLGCPLLHVCPSLAMQWKNRRSPLGPRKSGSRDRQVRSPGRPMAVLMGY